MNGMLDAQIWHDYDVDKMRYGYIDYFHVSGIIGILDNMVLASMYASQYQSFPTTNALVAELSFRMKDAIVSNKGSNTAQKVQTSGAIQYALPLHDFNLFSLLVWKDEQ